MNNVQIPCKHCNKPIFAKDKFCSQCGEKNTYSAGEIIELLTSSGDPDHKNFLDDLEQKIKTPKISEDDTLVKVAEEETLTPKLTLKEKVAKNNLDFSVWANSAILIGFILFVIAVIIWQTNLADQHILFGITAWLLALVGVTAVLNGISDLISKPCSKCGARGTIQENADKSDKLINRAQGYETVTRQEKNRDGQVIREYQEQVRVQKSVYEVYSKCTLCHQEYAATRQSNTHDFDN